MFYEVCFLGKDGQWAVKSVHQTQEEAVDSVGLHAARVNDEGVKRVTLMIRENAGVLTDVAS